MDFRLLVRLWFAILFLGFTAIPRTGLAIRSLTCDYISQLGSSSQPYNPNAPQGTQGQQAEAAACSNAAAQAAQACQAAGGTAGEYYVNTLFGKPAKGYTTNNGKGPINGFCSISMECCESTPVIE